MDFGYAVFEPGALDLILYLAIPENAFQGDKLPLLESIGEFGEIPPGKDAVPFDAGSLNDPSLMLTLPVTFLPIPLFFWQ